jgi:hypothetical protein
MSERIPFLSQAVVRTLGCACHHIQTVPVRATGTGLPAWEGDVEVFELQGHPQARRAFAWLWPNDSGERRYTIMPGIPPIASASEAVLSALRSGVAPDHE